MTNKIQGEGDYESARRYNKHTADSVKKGLGKIPVRDADADSKELLGAEEDGKQRAKELKHDKKDAALMKQAVEKKTDKKAAR